MSIRSDSSSSAVGGESVLHLSYYKISPCENALR